MEDSFTKVRNNSQFLGGMRIRDARNTYDLVNKTREGMNACFFHYLRGECRHWGVLLNMVHWKKTSPPQFSLFFREIVKSVTVTTCIAATSGPDYSNLWCLLLKNNPWKSGYPEALGDLNGPGIFQLLWLR